MNVVGFYAEVALLFSVGTLWEQDVFEMRFKLGIILGVVEADGIAKTVGIFFQNVA